jgi:hypothetical protein
MKIRILNGKDVVDIHILNILGKFDILVAKYCNVDGLSVAR